jgi:N-acyl-D-amino-acid deacylase
MLDLIIRNGQIIDGSGAPALKLDVGIIGDKIVEKGDLQDAQATQIIDAMGRFVTPGFIDIHTHTDETIHINPRMESKVQQGVTTELAGNCGVAGAPLMGAALEDMQRRLKELGSVEVNWNSMAQYLDHIQHLGISGNYATLVGHAQLRASVMGYAMRAPTADELEQMETLTQRSLEEGAWGMSSGLIYPPSSYAETDELIALSRMVAAQGGIYASHIRDEGDKLFEAVGEALTIGRRAGVRVQLSHHKAAGKPNWGKVHTSLEMIEQARAEGIQVSADQYPYIASSTGLSVVLPGWAHEGGLAKMSERLASPAIRQRIANDAKFNQRDWESIMVVGCKSDRSLQGKTIREIAEQSDKAPVQVVCDLLVANDVTVQIVIFMMSEEDVRTVMPMPWVFAGSDAGARAPTGLLAQVKYHPRAYGTFPRLLGRYVRELQIMKWEEAIAKMTERPAQMLGLDRRGALRLGYYADIVVLDPASITDTATFAEPIQFPSGIDYVIVNGVITVDHGQHTGARAGQVLRKK